MNATVNPQVRATVGNPRIRVLQVIQSLHFGGAEKVVAHLAAGVDRSRFEMRVACTREIGRVGKQLRESGIPVIDAAPGRGYGRYFGSWQLLKQLCRYRPDVIHTHGIGALTAYGPLAMLGMRSHWIHTFHYGNYPYPNARHMALEGFFARRAPCLVAVAGRQREAILALHRTRAERTIVVSNGVQSNPHLEDPSCRQRKRAEFGLAADDFVIGSICVMSEQKGIQYLLEAAVAVLRDLPRVRFLLVGGGPLEARLRARALELGVNDSVIFTGWRADAQELMTALDVFVMPSLWEAMPLALLEAMSSRRAIVVTDVGNNAEVVDGGKCALLVEPRNSGALHQALKRLAGNRDLVDSLAAAALARFRSHYTISHMIEAYQRLYQAS